MMPCYLCKDDAAKLHLTEVDKRTGKPFKLDLCKKCAAITGLLTAEGTTTIKDLLAQSIGDILAAYASVAQTATDDDDASDELELSESLTPDETEQSSPPVALSCSKCKIKFDEVKSSGRFGCAEDYVVFQDQIEPLLKKLHGAIQHVGKKPVNFDVMRQRHQRLRELKLDLEAAVVLEDYELAARLRDEIKQLSSYTGRATPPSP